MSVAVFALFAALALASALIVVLHRNPVYSVMSLVVTLVSLAALFVMLGAPFLGALQILVYTGAILVLFLFVIMLLNVGREASESGGGGQRLFAILAAALFGLLIGVLLWGRYQGLPLPALTAETVAVRPLAQMLLSSYILPFEIVGVLLLAAVIAATVLAAKTPPGEDESP